MSVDRPNELLEKIFMLKENEMAAVIAQDDVIIVQLLKKELPLIKSKENTELRKKFTQQFNNSINQDIVASLIEGFNNQNKVEINQKTIDRINLSLE